MIDLCNIETLYKFIRVKETLLKANGQKHKMGICPQNIDS